MIYLNDVEGGGETRFPRAVNNNNSEGLEITPKVGSAVLFYNSLEDGNFDDLSQHGGNKVLAGNKWLANLWVRNVKSPHLFNVDTRNSHLLRLFFYVLLRQIWDPVIG